MQPGNPPQPIALRDALRTWSHIGLNSFGGPAGQISVMHREVVMKHGWVDEERFTHALSLCMLLPGPEAQQLATYLGWALHGIRGGIAAGLLFIAPGVVVMLGLSVLYVTVGSVPLIAALLYGLQAAVIALVVQACVRLGRRTTSTRLLGWLAVASFAAVAVFGLPFPLVIVAAALVGWLAYRGQGAGTSHVSLGISPKAKRSALMAAGACAILWILPLSLIVLALGMNTVLAQEAVFFSKAALVTFGGAYAVLGYVAQQAVGHFGWVTSQDMVVGLGLAETTPGPLVLVLQFVGFVGAYENPGSLPPLIAGTLGALVTVWMTFVPCFLFIFLGAPFVEQLRKNTALTGALRGISAAVVGVIAALGLWFVLHTLFTQQAAASWGPLGYDVPVWHTIRWEGVAIAATAGVLAFRFRWSTMAILATCCTASLVIWLAEALTS